MLQLDDARIALGRGAEIAAQNILPRAFGLNPDSGRKRSLSPLGLDALPLGEGAVGLGGAAGEIAGLRALGDLPEQIVDQRAKIAALRAPFDRLPPFLEGRLGVRKRLSKVRCVASGATGDFENEFARSFSLLLFEKRLLDGALPRPKLPLRHRAHERPDDRAGNDVGLADRRVLRLIAKLGHADDAGQLLAAADEGRRPARSLFEPVAALDRPG